MASDHLWLRIVFGQKQHKLLMYSPSYVKGLKEELSLRHGISVGDIEVFHEGEVQTDGERVIDGRVYVMRSLAPMGAGTIPAVEDGVFVGEGVTLTQDVLVHHSLGAQTLSKQVEQGEKVYTVFGYRGIIHLVDMERGGVLSPALLLRMGRCVLYVDWSTLRYSSLFQGKGSQVEWLIDHLRRDYGIDADSVVRGIHMAGVDGITRYQNIVMAWLDAMGISDEEDAVEEEEEEEEDGDVEEEAEFDEMEGDELWR